MNPARPSNEGHEFKKITLPINTHNPLWDYISRDNEKANAFYDISASQIFRMIFGVF